MVSRVPYTTIHDYMYVYRFEALGHWLIRLISLMGGGGEGEEIQSITQTLKSTQGNCVYHKNKHTFHSGIKEKLGSNQSH